MSAQSGPFSADDRLDSWKEIAAYLGREVRTVQGWEKTEGLPVHRHQHARQGSVYAFKSVDAWREPEKAHRKHRLQSSVLPRLLLRARLARFRVGGRGAPSPFLAWHPSC